MATKNFIEELEWRGMIHTIMPGAKEQLEKEQTTAYLGIDPTADSLHIGHLVGVMILKHFQMLSLIHISEPRDVEESRMPSSA